MIYEKKDCKEIFEIPEEEIASCFEADVVIVGGGHAGTQCALAAVEQGLSVIVLETLTEEKMRWKGEQIGAFNSKYHLEHGFGPYDTDEIADELYRCSSYMADPVLLKKYVENSGEMIDNMLSLFPKDTTLLDPDQFNIHQAFGNPEYPVRRGGTRTWAATMSFRGPVVNERPGPECRFPHRGTNYGIGERSRLSEVEMLALNRSRELGAEWLFGSKTVALRQDEAGQVTGAIARRAEGYIECRAKKGVVLSSGNMNRSGLELGLSVGGHSEQVLQLEFAMRMVNDGLGGGPFLTLNARGKRFFDESNFYAAAFAIDRQPDGIVSVVMDAHFMDTLSKSGIQHGTPDFGRPEFLAQFLEDFSHVADAGPEGYQCRDLNTSEREMFRFYGADTLEKLAEYLGYTGEDATNFTASVKHYNELCHAGKDTDFGKDAECMNPIETPPYYGARSMLDHQKSRNVSGLPGLLTDNDFNVVDAAGNPIPGLYAVGNCLGARFGPYYATPCGGIYIGMAMTHGRVLGKQLGGKTD